MVQQFKKWVNAIKGVHYVSSWNLIPHLMPSFSSVPLSLLSTSSSTPSPSSLQPSVRKTHNSGRKHKEAVKLYYMNWLEQEAQNMMAHPGMVCVSAYAL